MRTIEKSVGDLQRGDMMLTPKLGTVTVLNVRPDHERSFTDRRVTVLTAEGETKRARADASHVVEVVA